MADRSLDYARMQVKRGKSARPKRQPEPGRAVRDADGNVIAQVRGRNVTAADLAQAAALVAWMPTYTTPTSQETP